MTPYAIAGAAAPGPHPVRPEHRQLWLAASDWAQLGSGRATRMLLFRAHARRARCRRHADPRPALVLDHYGEPAPARRYRARAFYAGAGLPPPPAQQLQRALNHAALARERARLLAGHDEKSPTTRRINACAGAGGLAWLSLLPGHAQCLDVSD
jgi:hypothetical protein